MGFVSIRLDTEKQVGEIGLNAVDPPRRVRSRYGDLRVCAHAHEGSGNEGRHGRNGWRPEPRTPARRAYRKVGFDLEIPSVWMFKKL